MIEHKPTTDASGFNPFRSSGYEAQMLGSAQCGNLADLTANSTFIVMQTTYYPLHTIPGPTVIPTTIHTPKP